MIAFKYEQLEKLTLEQLKQAYDVTANNTVVGLDFYRQEISRRETELLNSRLLVFTKQMRDMTLVVVALTVINIILVVISLWK